MAQPPVTKPKVSAAARATIIAAVIGAIAVLVAAGIGYVKSSSSGQPTTVTNIINSGFQVLGNLVIGNSSATPSVGGAGDPATPVAVGQRVQRELSLNEATTFDTDVTVSVTEYHVAYGATVWVNGQNLGWRKPGARLNGRTDKAKSCFVELKGYSEGPAINSKPKFKIDYFCQPAPGA